MDNKDKDLVFQFTVKFTQDVDCGGGYLKLIPYDTNQLKFDHNSDYFVSFGPDVCGRKKEVVVNFRFKDKSV